MPRLSALKNVELPLIYSRNSSFWSRRKRAKVALERVGLAERIRHRPNQLSDLGYGAEVLPTSVLFGYSKTSEVYRTDAS